jgi:sugar lactone lactonase YvrE
MKRGLGLSLALVLTLGVPLASSGAAMAAAGPVQVTLPFTGLGYAQGVAVDAGDVFVTDTDNNQVLELPAGSSTSQALPFANLNSPWGVAVDAAGDVYVVDQGNDRVVELPAGSSTQRVLPFSGLHYPWGVAVDSAGDVYVSDGYDRVLELPAGSSTQQLVPFTGLQTPTGITTDAAGDVYVADGAGQVLEMPAGSSTSQLLPFTGLSYLPEDVAADAAGDAYVADGGNGRVVELSGYVATDTAIASVTPATPVAGRPFTVAVSLTSASGGLVPGGQVVVSDGGSRSCTVTLAADTGSCQLTGPSGGPYTVTASYAGHGRFAASKAGVDISMDAAPAFITATPPATVAKGHSYGYAFTASGIPAPAYALAAGAPAWLTINAATGVLSGTVPAGTTSFRYAVTAANAAGTVTTSPFTVNVTHAAPPAADLSAALACPRTLNNTEIGNCTLTVHNAGQAGAHQVTAELALPAALARIECNPSCTPAGNVLTWPRGFLAAGATVTENVSIRVRRGARTAVILGAAVSLTSDPQPGNNVSTAPITLTR